MTALHTDRVLAYQRRVRALEMFAGGATKSAIARELGVARQNVIRWSQRDKWDERLGQPAPPKRVMSSGELDQASQDGDELARAMTGNLVAATLVKLRTKLGSRVAELETLCGPNSTPTVRLRAIEVWLKLAGVRQIMPDPSASHETLTPRDLQLLDDLASTELRGVERLQDDVGLSPQPDPSNSSLRGLRSDDDGDTGVDAERSASPSADDLPTPVTQPVAQSVSGAPGAAASGSRGPEDGHPGPCDKPSDDDELYRRIHGGSPDSDNADGTTGLSAWRVYDH